MTCLYIVSTPIGNLADISQRAIDVLNSVSLIAAEDTRHSRHLLDHFGIRTPVVACHEHNENDQAETFVRRIQQGESIALISDAGTPLVSDPGYRLVRAALDHGVPVSPVPGASAVLAALAAAGLPTDQFSFRGFLPSRPGQRLERLKLLARQRDTTVIFETPHRIIAAVDDMRDVLGADRKVTIARELTKRYEQIWSGDLEGACRALANEEIPARGEFVIVFEGVAQALDVEAERLMSVLMKEVSPSTAASLASEILGRNRKALYAVALSLKNG